MWLSNFAWDGGVYGTAVAVMLALLAAHASQSPQMGGQRGAALAVLLLAYGPASICLTYLLQQAFKVRWTGSVSYCTVQLVDCAYLCWLARADLPFSGQQHAAQITRLATSGEYASWHMLCCVGHCMVVQDLKSTCPIMFAAASACRCAY
jgi:hypothetical protein